VLRVRGVPGVERADNLIVQFMNLQLPSGAEEGTLVYALDDFAAWSLPWSVADGNVDDLRRGDYVLMDRSAARRFGRLRRGRPPRILHRRFRITGTTRGAISFTTAPITFMDYRRAQGLTETMRGNTTYILVKLAPDADAAAVSAEIRRRLPYNDVYRKGRGPRARATTGSSRQGWA